MIARLHLNLKGMSLFKPHLPKPVPLLTVYIGIYTTSVILDKFLFQNLRCPLDKDFLGTKLTFVDNLNKTTVNKTVKVLGEILPLQVFIYKCS